MKVEERSMDYEERSFVWRTRKAGCGGRERICACLKEREEVLVSD
jgi:hypothetical protein